MTYVTQRAAVESEWCDHHGGYVEPGATRPYERGSRYRICSACVATQEAEVAAREAFCPICNYLVSLHIGGRCPEELGPGGARARAGDP